MNADKSPKVARDLLRLHGLRARAVAEEHARQAQPGGDVALWIRAASLIGMVRDAAPGAPAQRLDVMRARAALPDAA